MLTLHITPKSIIKRVTDIMEGAYAEVPSRDEGVKVAKREKAFHTIPPQQIGKHIKKLAQQMLEHAKNLEFEQAAQIRDELFKLKHQVFD